MTPYEKLRSLPGADGFLKPGITFEQLDAVAQAATDLQAAQEVQRGPQGALSARRQGAEPRSVIRPAAPSARFARLGGGGPLPAHPPQPQNRCLHQPSPSHSPRALPSARSCSCPGWKTLYHPGFPASFGSIDEARDHCRSFFRWYNHEHRHGGIALLTPAQVHTGQAPGVIARRNRVLATAYAARPDRFVNGQPANPELPPVVWINPPLPVTVVDAGSGGESSPQETLP